MYKRQEQEMIFMHISILLMEQIIELFIMILRGFIIVKAGIVKDEDLSLIHIEMCIRDRL